MGIVLGKTASNSLHRVSACLIAYFLWLFLSEPYPTDLRCLVPLRVTNTESAFSIKHAPPYITITLRGLRRHIRSLDTSRLVCIIDEKELKPGLNMPQLTERHLALPSRIRLVNYAPINLTIETCSLLSSTTQTKTS
jgi:hypothetical protein